MFYVQGFYKIKKITKWIQYKDVLKKYLLSKSVKGTVILSPEGINSTIAGKKKDVNNCIKYIKDKFSITSFDSHNSSISESSPFYRTKVKVKGMVKKGQMLVTSSHKGFACATSNPKVGTVIGKSLEAKTTPDDGEIFVVVGRV